MNINPLTRPHNNKISKKALRKLLDQAIKKLIEKDSYLLENDVHEQSISSKMSCYLSALVLPRKEGGWDVDAEYNRNNEKPKSLESIGIVKPDIIIHRRGLNNPRGYEDNNLLIVEIKKSPSICENNEGDIRKIRAFINDDPYYYCHGAFIVFNGIKPSIQWFERDVVNSGRA